MENNRNNNIPNLSPKLGKKESYFTSDFKVMLQIVFWNGLGMFYMEFLLPYIATIVLNSGGIEIGIFVSIQIVGYLISTMTAGILTDRSSKTRLILIGSFGRGISYLFFYIAILTKTLWIIGISTFILGIGAGFFWVPFNTMVAEKSSPDIRSQAYGRRSSALGFGIMVGSTIGFFIFIECIHTNISVALIYSPLILFAVANFYAGFQFLFKVDENLKYKPPDSNTLLYSFSNSFSTSDSSSTSSDSSFSSSNNTAIDLEMNVTNNSPKNSKESWSSGLKIGIAFLMIVLILESINGTITAPYMQIFLLNNVSPDPNVVLMIYIPGGIVQMLLASKIGALADHFNPKLSLTISSSFGAIITYFLVNTSNPWIVAILWCLDNTVVSLGFFTVQNLLSRSTFQYRGKIFGSQETITNIGGIIGPLIGGFAWDHLGMKSPFYISVIFEISLIPFYLLAIHWLVPHLKEKTSKELESPDNSLAS
ncbi:MAG: MFS transporter [Candidatus Lokiarchaeota archaeon]|nr:MFS transporter [Candidatus Harpocratesius repetitus]